MQKILRRIFQPPARRFDQPKPYAAVHPFDRQFGVQTSGHIPPEDLTSKNKKDLYNTGYFGVAPSVFRQILDRLKVDFRPFTFIDLGSGKGRALFLASEHPFQAIIGVELSPALHAIAANNLLQYRGPAQRCGNIRLIESDATEFSFPGGPLVVYLWNPFDAPVFRVVLANLKAALASEHREIYILYIQPELDSMLQASAYWQMLWSGEFPLSDEDYAAHAFPSRLEVCSAYKSISPFRS